MPSKYSYAQDLAKWEANHQSDQSSRASWDSESYDQLHLEPLPQAQEIVRLYAPTTTPHRFSFARCLSGDDEALGVQAAVELSRQSSRIVYHQPRATRPPVADATPALLRVNSSKPATAPPPVDAEKSGTASLMKYQRPVPPARIVVNPSGTSSSAAPRIAAGRPEPDGHGAQGAATMTRSRAPSRLSTSDATTMDSRRPRDSWEILDFPPAPRKKTSKHSKHTAQPQDSSLGTTSRAWNIAPSNQETHLWTSPLALPKPRTAAHPTIQHTTPLRSGTPNFESGPAAAKSPTSLRLTSSPTPSPEADVPDFGSDENDEWDSRTTYSSKHSRASSIRQSGRATRSSNSDTKYLPPATTSSSATSPPPVTSRPSSIIDARRSPRHHRSPTDAIPPPVACAHPKLPSSPSDAPAPLLSELSTRSPRPKRSFAALLATPLFHAKAAPRTLSRSSGHEDATARRGDARGLGRVRARLSPLDPKPPRLPRQIRTQCMPYEELPLGEPPIFTSNPQELMPVRRKVVAWAK